MFFPRSACTTVAYDFRTQTCFFRVNETENTGRLVSRIVAPVSVCVVRAYAAKRTCGFYSAGFRNVEEAPGPSLVVAPFFNYAYPISVHYTSAFDVQRIYYIMIHIKIIFYSKVRLNTFNYVEQIN